MSPKAPKKKARVFLPPSNLKEQLSRAGGKSRDRHGRPLTIKMKGNVEVYLKEEPEPKTEEKS